MLCDLCQENEATIHIQEIVDGHKKTLNICNECAAKKQHPGGMDIGTFNLAEILYNIEKLTQQAGSDESPDPEPSDARNPGQPGNAANKVVCPECGWDVEKIRKFGGRLGCPACYKVFRPVVEPALNNMHRATSHIGKVAHVHNQGIDSEQVEWENQLAAARVELENLVREEQYEQAAVKRDQINSLREKIASRAKQGAVHEASDPKNPEA